jgi:hypothetical protein
MVKVFVSILGFTLIAAALTLLASPSTSDRRFSDKPGDPLIHTVGVIR